jgi:predicted TIM-barrel fold metal-dependent hydrolase
MDKLNRRKFCSAALGTAVLGSLAKVVAQPTNEAAISAAEAPYIIDTNVTLGQWPFRSLKYAGAKALGSKLKKHRIKQAWAGSFDALFHKDIDAVNAALSRECAQSGDSFFLPFGTVNLAWPEWMEDLRRCHEVYKMKGVRIYPSYQTFDLSHPDFPKLVHEVSKRNLILQIVGDMDDSRNHHPLVLTRNFSYMPLKDVLKNEKKAKVHLLYWNHRISAKQMDDLVDNTQVLFDIARVETNGGIEAMLEGNTNKKDRVFTFGGLERTVSEIPWGRNSKPVPADRVTFGSHAPYFPVEANLLKLFESDLSLEQTRSIMETNASRLLNL